MILTLFIAATIYVNRPGFAQGPANSPQGILSIPSALVKLSETVKVPAEYGGVLTDVPVREGQLVRKGDLIARVNDRELRLRVERAAQEDQIARLSAQNDVDIRYAIKSSEVAQSELARSHRSNAKVANSVPASRVDRQRLERDRAVLQQEQAKRDYKAEQLKTKLTRNELDLSNLLLEKTEIRSPMNGMVVAVERKRGEWVEPSETVVKIVRVDRLRVEGFVAAEKAGLLTNGDVVEVRFSQAWLKSKMYPGKIVFISPEANPVNSQLMIWAEIENADGRLVPGLRGEIRVQLSSPPVADAPLLQDPQLGRR